MIDPERHPRFVGEGLTFDDVLLVPEYSEVHPRDTDIRTRLTGEVELQIPILAAAMDTVSESRMAIAIAREGGLAVIHKNMPIDRQAAEVDRVKRSESGMILNPITLGPDKPLRAAVGLMAQFSISGVPIIIEDARVVGMISIRTLYIETDLERPISEDRKSVVSGTGAVRG